jgi:hypothetical protein
VVEISLLLQLLVTVWSTFDTPLAQSILSSLIVRPFCVTREQNLRRMEGNFALRGRTLLTTFRLSFRLLARRRCTDSRCLVSELHMHVYI